MTIITRMLTGLLTRSAWLLGPDRAEWLEGLVAEATETRAGRARVVWLLGGVWLTARELLRRSAIRALAFIAAAAIVLWVAWPGSSSDSAVPVNRIEIPLYLALLALLPLMVRRFFGPVRPGLLPRMVRVVGYLVVLALVAGEAVEAREGQRLGAYFADGGKVAAVMVLVIVGYTGAILILTSHRVRLTRSALPVAIATGTLTGVVLYARFGFHLDNPPLTWWLFVALVLPLVTGFAVTRRAARDTPAKGMSPAAHGGLVAVCATGMAVLLLVPLKGVFILGFFLIPLALILLPGFAVTRRAARDTPANAMSRAAQGGLVAVCATGTAVLLLAALTTVTIALAPQRVPLQTPQPPRNGGCETCDPNSLVIPPGLRHEYWVGLSIAQENLPFDLALIFAPMFALFPGGIGVGLAEASLRTRKRSDSPSSAPPPAPCQA
ncbi:MAG: hypothetical protein ACLPZR_17170 [Solirubrobacteraceae bacterium]